MLIEQEKIDLRKRLKKVAGQINGIDKMVDEGRYCIDIIQQILAAKAALNKVALMMVESHAKSCVVKAIKADHADESIDAILDGSIDGGATYSEALDAAKARGVPTDDLIILAQTDAIPKDAIAGRPGLDQHLVKELQQAFKELTDKDTQYTAFMSKTKINGFIEAQDESYDIIRKAAKFL